LADTGTTTTTTRRRYGGVHAQKELDGLLVVLLGTVDVGEAIVAVCVSRRD